MNDLTDLLGRLIKRKLEFVLVGGFAAIAHGATYVTRDLDVCLDFNLENLHLLSDAVSDLHPKHRMTLQKLPFVIDPASAAYLKNVYLETDWGILDCLGEVLGIGNFQDVKASSVQMELPFGTCRVLSIDALIQAKERMARPHDLLTVTQLKALRSSGATSR